MPIKWNLKPWMDRRGIANPNQLAERAGLTLPVAYRLFEERDLERIDIATLETLAAFFRCSPWRLLEYRKR